MDKWKITVSYMYARLFPLIHLSASQCSVAGETTTPSNDTEIDLLETYKIGVVQCSGLVYRVSMIEEPPFMMKTKIPVGGVYRYKGFMVDLLIDLQRKLSVDLHFNPVKDNQYGGIQYDGTWFGMVGELVRGEADIAGPLTVTSARARVVRFTQPFMTATPKILVKKPMRMYPSPHSMLLVPFSAELWLTVLAAYIISSVTFYLVYRWSPVQRGRPVHRDFSTYNSLQLGFSITLGLDTANMPQSVSGRLLRAVWRIFAIILLSVYVASLIVTFFQYKPIQPHFVQTYEDLLYSRIEYGTVAQGNMANVLRTSQNPVMKKMWETLSVLDLGWMVSTATEGVDRVRKSRGMYAFILEAPIAEYMATLVPCDVYVARESDMEASYALACRNDSGICDRLDLVLLELKESGRLSQLRSKWFEGKTCIPHEDRTNKNSGALPLAKGTVSIRDSYPVFVFLLVGLVVSLLVCGVEHFLKRGKSLVPPDDENAVPKEAVEDNAL